MIVTIDGPAGTGKSTIAKLLAKRLGFAYFDTGAMYRAVTYLALKKRLPLSDGFAIAKLIPLMNFTVRGDVDEKRYFIDTEDVSEAIRSHDVTMAVSEVAAHGEVRRALVEIQRRFGQNRDAIFEGRDMGTVVFPEAEVKLFLTADPLQRAKRRYLELHKKLLKPPALEEVFADLQRRDKFDSSRELSPLKPAFDAHIVDTTYMSIEEVVQALLGIIEELR